MGRIAVAAALIFLGQSAARSQAAGSVVACASKAGERQTCAADASQGATLVKSNGAGACLLGKTWGYDDADIWVSDGCSGEFSVGRPASKHFGTYTPDVGFKVVDTEEGELDVKVYTYVRYLNEKGLDGTYTNAFGQTSAVQQRQDLQVNKLLVYFLGWFLSPKFRYLTYVWSTNVSQGQLTQVVAAGNLTYTFNDHFTLGAGVNSLPGVRSTEGVWPYLLGIDERLIADEFFRPSYTTGIFAKGNIVHGLDYNVMLGNNLSQLGIDAGQLDNGLNTLSGELVWMPTTGEYGKHGAFGDFEDHQKVATRLGGHFTRSDETSQSQPASDNFDNVQIRLSDGTVIFMPGLFGPGVIIKNVLYNLADVDAGVKYHGFALEGEYYYRWLNHFKGPGTPGLPKIIDDGFQLQASMMARPKSVQLYASGSLVLGKYGNPWDARLGVNWYPWRTQSVRANAEYIQLHRSPVGALSLPYAVGGNGPAVNLNLVVSF